MPIQTVTGPISQADAGFVLSHEHILLDCSSLCEPRYDHILDDAELAIDELHLYREEGGTTLVDCTSIGLGRNPTVLRDVSIESGVRVVMGTGWYREPVYPTYVHELGVDELADRMIGELLIGADETSVRAGIIGEIGTERGYISRAEEGVFRAAARAQRRTGVGIWTHTTNFGELASEQVALLIAEGVRPNRIVIGHMGERIGYRHIRPIAEAGVYLGIDSVGYCGPGFPSDEARAQTILELIENGHEDQILLSGDICTRSALRAYGGKGYGYISRVFLPLLSGFGVTKSVLHKMTVLNPSRALTAEETA